MGSAVTSQVCFSSVWTRAMIRSITVTMQVVTNQQDQLVQHTVCGQVQERTPVMRPAGHG